MTELDVWVTIEAIFLWLSFRVFFLIYLFGSNFQFGIDLILDDTQQGQKMIYLET